MKMAPVETMIQSTAAIPRDDSGEVEMEFERGASESDDGH